MQTLEDLNDLIRTKSAIRLTRKLLLRSDAPLVTARRQLDQAEENVNRALREWAGRN